MAALCCPFQVFFYLQEAIVLGEGLKQWQTQDGAAVSYRVFMLNLFEESQVVWISFRLEFEDNIVNVIGEGAIDYAD